VQALFLHNPGLDVAVFGGEARARLEAAGATFPLPALDAAAFDARSDAELAGIEVIFGCWGTPRLDEARLRRLPKLRAVFYGAGTVKGIVSDAFYDRGLVITTAAAANAVPVADYTFAQVILALKGVPRLEREMRAQRGRPAHVPEYTPGTHGGTIALISLGLIGRLVLERLQRLHLRLLVHDPFVPDDAIRALGADPVSLHDAFRLGEIVSLHTPLLPATRGMIRSEHIRALPPRATLINTARGGLIDEPGLIEALRERPDLTALLDVTDPEPPSADSPLYDLPNVFLTPHIAGSQGRELQLMGLLAAGEFERFRAGLPLQHAVSREQLQRMA
jgi:phosphoglycerate dehydrogenase-like enzyme